MDIKNYLQQFTKMVDELKAHPKVQLLSFHAFEPASESEIAEVETHLGFSLDEDLKTFYRQCNGLQLRWAHLDNPGWDRKELTGFVQGPFTYQDVVDDAGTIDGCVNILPIKEVFLTDWIKKFGVDPYHPNMVKVGKEKIPYDSYARNVKVFDLSHYSSSFSLLVMPSEKSITVIRGSDNHVFHYSGKRSTVKYFLTNILLNFGHWAKASTFYNLEDGLIIEDGLDRPILHDYAQTLYGNLDVSTFAD